MIKTNFSVNSEEKNRILNLHESATKNQYLISEESDFLNLNILPPTKEEVGIGKDFVSAQMLNPNYQSWLKSIFNDKNYDEYRKVIEPIDKAQINRTEATKKELGRLGRYLKKNPQLIKSIEDYASKNPFK